MAKSKKLPIAISAVLGMVGFAGVLSLTGCVPKPRSQPAMSKAAIHAVHSERLAQLMDALSKPADNLPRELDVAGERQKQIAEISGIAREMAIAAARIPDVLVEVDLNQEQKRTFVDLAVQLERQARELEQHAARGNFPQVAKVREQLNETCDFCHRRFRVLPLITE